MSPKVSICLSTRNRSSSLRQTICAMFAQTFQDWELIIGDDASTDGTGEVVASFSDPRIRYVRHSENLGIYRNWNALIGLCRGEYIAIYHDHDIYLPTIVEKSCALLDRFPKMTFVHTAIILLDQKHRPISLIVREFEEITQGKVFQRVQIDKSCVTAATAMVRRSAYDTAGVYDPSYGLPADVEMWLRLADTGDVGYIREPQALIMTKPNADAVLGECEGLRGNQRILREWSERIHGPNRRSGWVSNLRFQESVLRATLHVALYVAPERFPSVAEALSAHARVPVRILLSWARRSNAVRRLLRMAAARLVGSRLAERKRVAEAYCSRQNAIVAAFDPKCS